MKRIRPHVIFAWLAISVAACLGQKYLLEPAQVTDTRPGYNHKRHVVVEEIECKECHPNAITQDRAGMPEQSVCEECHDVESLEPGSAQAFFVASPVEWVNFTKLPDDVRFSHKIHVGKGLKCDECHAAIPESTRVTPDVAIAMDVCTDCHKQRNVPHGGDCATCHEHTAKDIKPASHAKNWKNVHGFAAESGMVLGTQAQCSLCHTQNACFSCHQQVPPRDHTDFWRRKGHGVAVSVDRERCQTCHKEDLCVRCHETATPESHRSSTWGGSTSDHCYNCHAPVEEDTCGVCHRNVVPHF